MHQDAHEFLNYLLNELVDLLEKEARKEKGDPETSSPSENIANGPRNGLPNGVQKDPLVTWVHKNFQGILTNETRCLQCETVMARDETFLDLSLDIEQNISITSCLKNFSSTETLNAEDKFFCDKCCRYFLYTVAKRIASRIVMFLPMNVNLNQLAELSLSANTPWSLDGSDCKEFSAMLQKALEGAIILDTFPKTTVHVFALVLESGGSDLPVVISCANLVLTDARIMLIASVSVSCLGKNLVIDPVLEEEKYQDGSLMITSMPFCNEVTQMTITGEWYSRGMENYWLHL